LRLPKILAAAVTSVLLAGGGTAVALSTGAARVSSLTSSAGSGDVTGVAPTLSATVSGPANARSNLSPVDSRSSSATVTTAGRGAVTDTEARLGGSSSGAQSTAGGGLSVPAGGVPLSAGADPALPATTATTAKGAPAVVLPTPTTGSLPEVAAMSRVTPPDAVVMLSAPLSASELGALGRLRGVEAIETVDTGTVAVGGDPVVAVGVNPSTFRNFTPAASASSDQLWRYVAAGSLVSSYDMADDRGLALGSTQVVTPAAGAAASSVKGWLGAFAAIGLPGVDLLVGHQYSSDLGLTPDSGVVVSAPALDGSTLQSELQSALPGGAVELLHADQLPTSLPGNTVGAATRQKILAAALSRVGLPYVWGGAGPSDFDCSGLVQWAFRQAGILMPRVAAEQFLTGDHIPLSDAQPGDLLFWTYDPQDPGYVDHVAIYLGNGLMVVAPHTGTDVQVAPVTTNELAGAVEVVLAS
jgi:cell wall-associated NlpC family hydrolase